MQNSIQIKIVAHGEDLRALLIAQLNELGYDGFEEEDNALLAYCPETDFDEAILEEILHPHGLSYQLTVIPAQNWNAVWESNFDPVVIEGFVAIRAEFHAPISGVRHEIVITPKMSFGTGHHATTRMMMQQMGELDFKSKAVFDFGTGTGILAILAEMLGAASVLAVDYDEWCITNASENIQRNHCSRTQLLQADYPPENGAFYDIILANINKNIILQFLPSLVQKLNKGGYLLLSGLLATDEADILTACKGQKLSWIRTITLDKWICMLFSQEK